MKEIRTEIEIVAPAERVWAVVTDFDRYGEWNSFITRAVGRLVPGEKLAVTIHPPGGRAVTFRPTVTAVEPGRRVVWLGHLGIRGIFDGEHIQEVEPISPGRTRYVQRENLSGVLVPFVGGILRKTEAGFRRMNEQLKERAES
jgi:hypothetical protein